MIIRLSSMKIVLLIGTIYSRISLEQMKTAIENVLGPKKLEHTIINPLFGHMFRTNGCLESIRLFSSELEIKYDDREERIYNKDQSKDSLTNLLIQLFPSQTGVLNNFRGTETNFTYMYFIKNQDDEAERKANIEMLGSIFARLVNKIGEKKIDKVGKKNKNIFKLLEYYVLSPSTVPDLNSKIIKLLAIQAYVVETFNTPDELETYLKSILVNSKCTKNVIHLELDDVQVKLFEVFYTNPFKFPYSKINQPVSNSSIPIYYRKTNTYDKDKKFSDCADITILHLCNCLFYNEQTEKCSLDHLELTKSFRLEEFFKEYHYRSFEVIQKMRNDWSRVVQGLGDNKPFRCQGRYRPYMIYYRKQDCRNEIRSGILNTMSVLANICGGNDAYKEIMTKGRISKDSVADILSDFFNKICNKKIKVTIKGSDIREIAHKGVNDFIGNFYITFDLDSKISVTMKLHISERHTSLLFEDMKSEQTKVCWIAPINLKSDDESMFLSFLINRYVKLLNNNDTKTEEFEYPFETMYNQGVIRTNEQKRGQCLHLCKFIDENKIFDYRITKRTIKNIVKSAILSDPETRTIFRPYFIFVNDVFEQMLSYEVFETWMLVFKRQKKIRSQSIKNSWTEAFKASSMKIRSMVLSKYYANSIDDVETILSATKEDILENLKLTELDLDPAKLTQLIQRFLVANKAVKALAFPKNNLSVTNILKILGLLKDNKSLRTLDISQNANFDAENAQLLFDALKNIASLTELNISGVFLEDAGIQCIIEILEKNNTLTTLDISDNSISKEDIKKVAAALEKNTTLTTLIISNSKLDPESIKFIADALKINNTLKTLDISSNGLGSDGIKCVADALESNFTLTTLNISETWSDENKNGVAEHIARILRGNTTLTALNISNNILRAIDAERIAEALRSNTTLTSLDISKTNLKDEGTKFLADIFAGNWFFEGFGITSYSNPPNRTLTKLRISGNSIENEGAKYIADAIRKSKSLVYLDISNNMWGKKGVKYMAKALAKNKSLKILIIQSLYEEIGSSRIMFSALKQNRSLEELSLSYFDSVNEIIGILKKNECLKSLDFRFSTDSFADQSKSLFEAIEKNTVLDKLILRTSPLAYFVVSDRMPKSASKSTKEGKFSISREFRRIEICLGNDYGIY